MNALQSNYLKLVSGPVMGVFAILLAGALVLFKQRMLFVDPCFVTFQIVNTGDFVITEHRYGAFITQWVPLLAGWLHLPLSLILLLYSASFYIFFFSVVLVLIYGFKEYWLALLLATYFTMFVSDVYFWPNNEVHQGMAWMFLFLGIARHTLSKKFSVSMVVLGGVTSFLAIFSHFIVMLPLLFIWIFLLLERHQGKFSEKAYGMYSLWLVSVMILKILIGLSGWYDGVKLKGITEARPNHLIDVFASGQAQTFLKNFITNYWFAAIVLVAGIVIMLLKRKYLQFAWTMISITGYFILVCLIFPGAYGRELLFYMESQWMAMAILISLPLAYYGLPAQIMYITPFFWSVFFAVRLLYIGLSFPLFDDRLTSLEELTSAMHEKNYSKVLIPDDTGLKEKFLMTWGLPVETLFLSNLQGYSPQLTLKPFQPEEGGVPDPAEFYSSFQKMKVSELNSFYFQLDSITPYVQMTHQALLAGEKD